MDGGEFLWAHPESRADHSGGAMVTRQGNMAWDWQAEGLPQGAGRPHCGPGTAAGLASREHPTRMQEPEG